MNREKIMNRFAFVTGVLFLSLVSAELLAQTAGDEGTTEAAASEAAETMAASETPAAEHFMVDVSDWKCEDCAFEEGYSGEVELGAGNVSDDSFRFGEYNGLNEEGAFAIVNAKLRYRDRDAGYLDLSLRELGLDSRSLYIEGGRQGSYSLFLSYDEITRYISDSVQTPYLGNGSSSLSLPAGWVPASSTAGMSQLNTSLQNIEVDSQRKRLGLGASFIPASDWKYDIKVRRETREGTRRSAGAFFFTAAELIEPVDYVTDEVDVSASYIGKKWQATLAYYGSFFSNDNVALSWDNAFNPPVGVAVADTGQLALPPDNRFHQLLLSAGYQYSQRTRISGDLAVGRMEQDEAFLPATVNTSLTVAPLPRNSADAQVDTLVGDLRLVSAFTDDLRFNASYSYSDHDNTTPQASYDWVTTDAYNTSPRTNQPYSFTRQTSKLGADYRVSRSTKVAAGMDYQSFERSYQEVEETRETTAWGKLTVRAKEFTDMTFRVARADRDVSSYQLVAETDPPQNPLLRKYNMADRDRTSVGVNANSMLSETSSIGVSVDYAKDDYTDSSLGLINATESNINLDSSVLVSERTSLHMFLGRQRIDSTQAGGQSTVVAQWVASNVDTVDSAGIGVKHRLKGDKLDLGADLVISQSTGRISIDAGAQAFPDLEVALNSLQLYADYRLQDNMTLHAAYWYEHYDSRDWALDGVDPDTINNLLSFGEDSPDYRLNVVTVTLRYKF
jgi:MtrB/PioB family decaheme-associated outer membrane protein